MSTVLVPRRRRVEEARKKKKKDTARTPESGESYQYRCPTRVGHQYFAKNGVSVQPKKKYKIALTFKYHKYIDNNMSNDGYSDMSIHISSTKIA